jgi:hypothetical protein
MNDDLPAEDNTTRFQRDFIKGCISFLTIAAIVRGETRDGETLFNELMDPVIGNRNRRSTGFDVVMPQIYEKVIEYCSEAINISNDIENKEMQQ